MKLLVVFEAMWALMELSYLAYLRKRSLKDLGNELGGMSGSGVVRVHERIQDKLKVNKTLNSRINNIMMLLGYGGSCRGMKCQ